VSSRTEVDRSVTETDSRGVDDSEVAEDCKATEDCKAGEDCEAISSRIFDINGFPRCWTRFRSSERSKLITMVSVRYGQRKWSSSVNLARQ
jgi:hypothetical protein